MKSFRVPNKPADKRQLMLNNQIHKQKLRAVKSTVDMGEPQTSRTPNRKRFCQLEER